MKEEIKIIAWVLTGILAITVLGWVIKPVDMFVDRVVTKHSFQYKEGMRQQAAIWEQQLVSLDIQLMEADSETRSQLEGQKRLIEAQLRAVTINQ